ncbi:MAG TPA: ATP-binding protein [Pirellulales bacterium]|nr:ATP-binding protein [Pirellulales bacterium]
MKRDILYVDDERDNLIVFEAAFEDTFRVHTANNGRKALELLEERPFPIVIADQRMPLMTGAELFEIMRVRYPHTKRVMLTGYADPKSMLEAINQGQVYYFVKKPWERPMMMSVMVRAIEAYDLSIANLALTDRLVAVDRCAALGRSAARIAHEMGNQLCMLPLLELIEEQYAGNADLQQAAHIARKTYDRLVQLVDEVKAFVRFEGEDAPLQKTRLSEALHELLEFLRFDGSFPYARVSLEIADDPFVRANRVKLQQVLINLLKNAAHAIRERAEGRIALAVEVEGPSVVLSVSDNGCGMAPEVAERIWEPFFTTKGDEGTGLGLDIVKAIVEAHGGQIECRTAPGAGARFIIRLPLVAEANESLAADVEIFNSLAQPPAAVPYQGLVAPTAWKET